MADPSVDLNMAFLRALQSKDYVVAMAVAKDLERLRPSDPNIPLFKELMVQATRQYSARLPVKKGNAEAPTLVEKEGSSSEDDEDKDDGMDWDNIGDPEAIEKLKKLGVMHASMKK